MKISVEALSHPPLSFSGSLPPSFPGQRLGGAKVLSATGSFGSLCIQEFDGSAFLIRSFDITTKDRFSFKADDHFSGLTGIIVQHGQLKADIKQGVSISLQGGQYTLLHAPGSEIIFTLAEKQRYIFFEILLTDEFAMDLVSEFNQHSFTFSKQRPEIWINPPGYIDGEVLEHIKYTMTYADNPAWRRNYYENRVWDIGWKLLALYIGINNGKDAITEEERTIAQAVQKIILENIDKHLLIKDLARMVGVSKSRLKKIFGKVYGMPIHVYRIQERLKKAVELLDQGKLVKEVAALTGWRSANFIRAYFSAYQTTPGKTKPTKK